MYMYLCFNSCWRSCIQNCVPTVHCRVFCFHLYGPYTGCSLMELWNFLTAGGTFLSDVSALNDSAAQYPSCDADSVGEHYTQHSHSGLLPWYQCWFQCLFCLWWGQWECSKYHHCWESLPNWWNVVWKCHCVWYVIDAIILLPNCAIGNFFAEISEIVCMCVCACSFI